MTVRKHRTLVATLLALLLGLQLAPSWGAAQTPQGGGIGIFPVVIELADALRGAEYLRTFTVINQEATDLELKFTSDGDINAWLTVHPSVDDLATQLDQIVVPAHSEARLVLRVAVPQDMANGRYTGGILFQGVPVSREGTSSGMGVALGIAADVTVVVTGTQQLSGAVLDAWVEDAEVDQPPVRLRIQFQNDGNVQVAPQVSWSILDGNGAEVAVVEQPAATVQPGFVEQLTIEWDPTGQPEGNYTSVVSVKLDGTEIDQRELGFELLPLGTLTRDGTLDRLTLEGEPQPGQLVKLVGYFRNTGQIDTRAVLTTEMYRDSQLIEVVTSLERVVTVGELALLETVYEVPEAGDYVVSGKVNFEGKETAVQTLEFSAVTAAPASSADSPQAAPVEELASTEVSSTSASDRSRMWLVGVSTVLAGGIALAFFLGRRRGAPAAGERAPSEERLAGEHVPIEDRGSSLP